MDKKMKKWYNARIDLLKAERDLVIESMKVSDNTKSTTKKTKTDFNKGAASMRVIPKKKQPSTTFSGPDPTIPKQGKSPLNLDVDEIIRLREKGWTLKRIAKRLKVSAPTIGNRLKKASWAPEKRIVKPHLKASPVRDSPKAPLSEQMLTTLKKELIDRSLTTEATKTLFSEYNDKTVSSNFSMMSMWLTEIGATWRIGKRPFVLKSRNKTKVKQAKFADYIEWKDNRYKKD